MPPRTRRPITVEPTSAPLPAAGHNSLVTDDDLVAENFKLEDQLKAGMAKYNEWSKPIQERVKEIETEISRRLLERKADSTKTEHGTAYFSVIMNTKIEDRELIIDFLMDNWEVWGNDMMQVNVTKDAVKRYMEEHAGQLPPGISISHFQRLNIKRS